MSGLDDYFDQLYAKMLPDFEQITGLDSAARPDIVPGPPDGFMIPPLLADELGDVRKLVGYIQVPDELLMDCGVIPDTRPKPPPPTRRERFRRKAEMWRNLAARRAYKIIAGYWPDDGEDDW